MKEPEAEKEVRPMMIKRVLVIGGVVAALAVPTGVAIAATGTPSPNPTTPSTTQPYGPRYGGGHGPMGGGYGDPEDCPYYNSAEHQKWMQDRQKLMQQRHDQMWSNGSPTS